MSGTAEAATRSLVSFIPGIIHSGAMYVKGLEGQSSDDRPRSSTDDRFALLCGQANSLAFSTDGKTLISAGDDTTILFWDVATITGRRQLRIDPLPAKDWKSLWTELASADAS